MTLNQLIKEIKQIAQSHGQVNNFFFGEIWNYLETKTDHVSVLLTLNSARFNRGQMVFNFSMYVMDWVVQEGTNELDVLSDTIRIGRDIEAAIRQLDIDMTDEIPCTPFIESFEDMLSGWKLDFDIATDYELDNCAAP